MVDDSVQLLSNIGQILADSVLDTIQPRRVADRTVPQGRFQVNVPIKKFIPALLEYANTQMVGVSVNRVNLLTLKVGTVTPLADHLSVEVKTLSSSRTVHVPYHFEKLRRFLLGQKVYYGLVQVQAQFLTLNFTTIQGGAEISFGEGIDISLRPIHWFVPILSRLGVTKAIIKSLKVYENHGEWEFKGLPGYILPTCNWT